MLRRGSDGGRDAAGEFGVQLVGPLGPDLPAAPLGHLLEILGPRFQRLGERFVAEKQPLDRLTGRVAIDVLGNSDPNARAGIDVDGHNRTSLPWLQYVRKIERRS